VVAFATLVLVVLIGAVVSKFDGTPTRREQPAPAPTTQHAAPAASSKLDGRVSVLLTVTFQVPAHRPGKNGITVFYDVAGVPSSPVLVNDSPWTTIVRVHQGQQIDLTAIQSYTDQPIPPSTVHCYINRVTAPLGSIDTQALRIAGSVHCQAPLGWT
jgi:hypothetical protein